MKRQYKCKVCGVGPDLPSGARWVGDKATLCSACVSELQRRRINVAKFGDPNPSDETVLAYRQAGGALRLAAMLTAGALLSATWRHKRRPQQVSAYRPIETNPDLPEGEKE